MRRVLLIAALLSVLALPTATAARARPAITVTRVVPITVRGGNFAPGERVRLTVKIFDTYRRKTVTAGRRGGFVAVYSFAAGKCVAIYAVARGNKGSRASTTVPATCAP